MEPEEPLGVERRLEEDLAARMPPLTMSSSCHIRRNEKNYGMSVKWGQKKR
jgi:hypothetical protein